MKIAVDLHFTNLKDGLYTDMGSEGRYAAKWAELLANNGQQVYCICGDNTYRNISWASNDIHIPNINIISNPSEIIKNRYDIAIIPGAVIPYGVIADLYMFMHFSTFSINSNDGKIFHPESYIHDNSIIVYPLETQFRNPINPYNIYENKTYFMPLPIAENMQSPDYNRLPSIAWTSRWGPWVSDDIYFHSMVKFAKIHNLQTKIFSFQNFYHRVRETEHEEGVKKIKEQLDLLKSSLLKSSITIEEIPSVPVNQLIEKLKITKFALSTHKGGLGGSMLEQVAYATFPLPGIGTKWVFPRVDLELYDNPYPETIDGIIKNWEIPLQDESFYTSSIKAYQKDVEPHLYSNCINQFSKIISKFGFKL